MATGSWSDEGIEWVLDNIPTLYLGLIHSTGWSAIAEGDTAAQNGGTNGWRESSAYSESVRQTYSPAAASSKSTTNAASTADFSINATATMKGTVWASTSVKADTSGVHGGAVLFTGGDRSVVNGNTLKVTFVDTGADAT